MKLTIVIPAYNEEIALPVTLKGLEANVKTPHNIIIVDDHSIDNTRTAALDFIKTHPNVTLVDNDTAQGITNAIKKGFSKITEGAIAVVMADTCDDPLTIDSMYEKIKQGFDVVCASRYMKGGKRTGRPLQGFFSYCVGFALYYLIGIPTHDCSNAFKMYRKHVLDSIDIEEAGFASGLEITVKAYFGGFKITEVPSAWKKREAGESKFKITSVAGNYFYWFFWSMLKALRGKRECKK